MELDELKKAWKAPDAHLNRTPLASEEDIERLIAAGRASTRKSLGSLSLMQRISLFVGGILLLLLVPLWALMPDFPEGRLSQERFGLLLLFIGISIVAGLVWDWKTHLWIRKTRIDEMSVVEVSRRMAIFRRQLRNEMIAICIWVVIFNALNFWVMGYHLAAPFTQILVIALLLVLDALIILVLYKKVLYKYLNDIHKNIEELKDICTE